MHAQSVEDPATFWGDIAKQFHWKTSPTKENFLSYNFNVDNGPIEVKINNKYISLISQNFDNDRLQAIRFRSRRHKFRYRSNG